MKKIKTSRVLGLSFFALLITLNITSTMKPNFGGEEVKAYSTEQTPCHSAGKNDPGYFMTYCLTCKKEKAKPDGVSGTCTKDDVVVN